MDTVEQPAAPRFCVIGNFSGRNAGDAAALGGGREDLSARVTRAGFDVATNKTANVRRSYPGYRVNPVGLLPWNLSVKIFGLPLWRCLRRADMVLVTDAILFDLRLFNPLFNYLSTMALALPWARRRGIPVVLYNVSLGPVTTRAGRWCLERVLNAATSIILRDEESFELLDRLGRSRRGAVRGADCALNVRPAPPQTAEAMLREGGVPADGPLVTFNVNSYLNVFVRGSGAPLNAEAFASIVAGAADDLVESRGVRIAFVVTQPMDLDLTHAVLARVKHRDRVGMVSNVRHGYRDLAAVFAQAELHLGMRTHSLILASAVGTPVVGIMATPKNRGYMRSIEQHEWMIEFDQFDRARLVERLQAAWDRRKDLRAALEPIVAREQTLARQAAQLLPAPGDNGGGAL